MEAQQRYQVIDQLAQGDFATVFSGRDTELNRDVAIKQIHAQYLQEAQQLDRYWQEAQLLASLQHPHIMTIYDVVRESGWLILELARGSLPAMLQGRGIDLKDLRLTLNYTLHALKHLHENGIIHGDIKPGNLLVDQNARVKLGDFGIARRLQGDDGSVVKGTTKYIAPEVMSDQFGPVGPHSDLYSLGFTAYELMCGDAFETLFPGLDIYGRDRQMAWLMWHSAVDRRVPEVQKVLEGVPDDLARIIEKLVEKDPSKRYQTTDQVLSDLSTDGAAPPPPDVSSDGTGAAEGSKTNRQRVMLIVALSVSMLMSLGMLFLPGGEKEPPPKEAPVAVRPAEGVVVEIDPDHSRFFVRSPGADTAHGITVSDADRIYVNDERKSFADLATDDQVSIKYLSSDGEEFMEIFATRELAGHATGELTAVNTTINQLTIGMNGGDELQVFANDVTTITLNDAAARFADLREADRVTVQHKPTDDGEVALSVAALRHLQLSGFVVSAAADNVTIRVGDDVADTTAEERELAVQRDCHVTLNNATDEDGRPLVIQDLRPGDRVTLTHDVAVSRIVALRDITETGTVTAVDYDQRNFTIADDAGTSKTFVLGAGCEITCGGEATPVTLSFLRKDDKVLIQRASPEPTNREAASIQITAQPDPRSWAIVIGYDSYDNQQLPPLQFVTADLDGVAAALQLHYRVPPNQLLVVRDATKLRLETDVQQFLPRVADDSQLLVYFLGHGFVAGNRVPYLVPQGFDQRKPPATGLALRWLLDRIEASKAREKVLLLDTSHESSEPKEWQTSATDFALSAKEVAARAVTTSAIVITGCDKNEVGLKLTEAGRGLFAQCLEEALKGRADSNRDHRVDYNELHRFLQGEMSKLASAQGKMQRPVLLLPDATPPRLSKAAREAVGGLLSQLGSRGRVNRQALSGQYRQARQLAGDQPEPHVAYGLVLLKGGFADDARQAFSRAGEHPAALMGLAWLQFSKDEVAAGNGTLAQLMAIPFENPRGPEVGVSTHAVELAGKLSGFGVFVRGSQAGLPALVQASKDRGQPTNDGFRAAANSVRDVLADFQQKIELADNDNQKSSLQRQRGNIRNYIELDYALLDRYVRAGMLKQ